MGRMYQSNYMTPDSLDDVRRLAHNARGMIDHVYLHWTAGWYGHNSLTEVKAHTLGRNTGAVGVSLCCCGDASATAEGSRIDLGSEPPTAQQIESLAEVVAVLADEFDLPLDTDEYVMTHYEAAKRDGYAWDLWFIPDYYGAEGALTDGGALIRGKAAWYQRKWRGEFMGD